MGKNRHYALWAAAVVGMTSGAFGAANSYWNGGDGNWAATDKWFLNTLPTSNDVANIETGTVTVNTAANCSMLYAATTSGTQADIYITNGADLKCGFTEYVGFNGPSVFTQDGGSNTTRTLFISSNSNGNIQSQYNLNGGTLYLASDSLGTARLSGSGILNIGNGTLSFKCGLPMQTIEIPYQSTQTSPVVQMVLTGSGKIDTDIHKVKISKPMSGTGGFEKIGTGLLTLTGTHTYTGATKVSVGELRVDGNITASSMITVGSGAKLTGKGTLGNTTVQAGGILSPGDGDGDRGTLFLNGDLTLESGAKLVFDLGGTFDLISMPDGTLNLNGLQIADVTLNTPGSLAVGNYTLIDAGNITGALGSNVSAIHGDCTWTLDVSSGDLVLAVASVPEPMSIALLGTGAWALLRRRR